MSYYSKIWTTATAPNAQRKWAGKAKDKTIMNWLHEKGLDDCTVIVHGVHKGRYVEVRGPVVVKY